jgi:hypothetical protein
MIHGSSPYACLLACLGAGLVGLGGAWWGLVAIRNGWDLVVVRSGWSLVVVRSGWGLGVLNWSHSL